MKFENIDFAKILSIGGTISGIAGTVISGIASDKKQKIEISKAVEEALKNSK